MHARLGQLMRTKLMMNQIMRTLNFRDQSIDGAGLPLLTEEHLTNSLGMKLGPALKLRSMLAKKLGGPCPCALCSVPTPPPARTNSSGSSSSKGDTTPTNRPPSNGSIG
ncbi:AGAP010158-PA-like protein [Anopheles sinensis]|uniref:AGAP010158-PA-like protein n=1 Tax=Anopheles sinensis TaxID=74873 RepID=A0A084WGB6_ANOSI|nr:AGAP010158-PA-like protein [Anopheles sinensis]